MDHENLTSLMTAVARYFDLMHEADVSAFDSIFRPTAQLHGLRNGQMRMLSASEYKAMLAAGPSPRSKGAPRQEQILLVDFASATQALVKVRVRVDTILYVDYLSYHFVDGDWLVSAKAFHGENVSGAA
ncbi:MAG: nuclear transport factor 2 family protein [Bradyrhizobium sp.]|jgi:hypothetical protein